MSAHEEIRRLRRARPRDRFVRVSLCASAVAAVVAWLSPDVQVSGLLHERRLGNLWRFVTHDALPHPVQDGVWTWSDLGSWFHASVGSRIGEAVLATLAIASIAIVAAGAFAVVAAPWAAQPIARRDPFARGRSDGWDRWRVVRLTVRSGLVLLRCVPEYFLAFLLVSCLGPSAWPAILALAMHNAGSLGRLGGDTLEHVDRRAPRALRGLGATRVGLVAWSVYPSTWNRCLLYFFYRFETCVREATVLGMLGIFSLGHLIHQAAAAHFHDTLILLVGLGALLVLAVDATSLVVRARLGRAAR